MSKIEESKCEGAAIENGVFYRFMSDSSEEDLMKHPLLKAVYECYRDDVFERDDTSITKKCDGGIVVIRTVCPCCGTPTLIPIYEKDIPMYIYRGKMEYTGTFKELSNHKFKYSIFFDYFVNNMICQLKNHVCFRCLLRSTSYKPGDNISTHINIVEGDVVTVHPYMNARVEMLDRNSRVRYEASNDVFESSVDVLPFYYGKVVKLFFDDAVNESIRFGVGKFKNGISKMARVELINDGRIVTVPIVDLSVCMPKQMYVCSTRILDNSVRVCERVVTKGQRRDGFDWNTFYSNIAEFMWKNDDARYDVITYAKDVRKSAMAKLNISNEVKICSGIDALEKEYKVLRDEFDGTLSNFSMENVGNVYWSYGRPVIVPKKNDTIKFNIYNYNGYITEKPNSVIDTEKPIEVIEVCSHVYLEDQLEYIQVLPKPIIDYTQNTKCLSRVSSNTKRLTVPHCKFKYTSKRGNEEIGLVFLSEIESISGVSDLTIELPVNDIGSYKVHGTSNDVTMIFKTEDLMKQFITQSLSQVTSKSDLMV